MKKSAKPSSDLMPMPADPLARAEHVLLTVRSTDGPQQYLSRRALGWILQMEEIAADPDVKPKDRATIFKDLVRLYLVMQPKEPKTKSPAGPGSGKGPREVHVHQHQHLESPDLSKLATDQLKELTEAFTAQVDAAKSDPTHNMTRQEKNTYDLLVTGQVVPGEELDNGRSNS